MAVTNSDAELILNKKQTMMEQLRPTYQHEVALQKFVHQNMNKSKIASMIYGICKNNGNSIGYSYGDTSEQPSTSVCISKTPPHLYSTFTSESAQEKTMKFADCQKLKTSHLSNKELRG
ncbi:hypothetical protein L195_g005399 [Trifolium pratense]|uniref:Uncharacterized protein n=1 Tax=Trifolium pratense TaxID=57577 RepID=A0A2K3P0P3_TRIPR|nr:hypothetical protein L195_g005399 [Trifolium pratense]